MTPRAERVAGGTAGTWHRCVAAWQARSAADSIALAVIGLAILAGGWLRISMAGGDLWLNEVWSLQLVGRVSSAPEVFYGISHDNNHFLNSLWLFWLGPNQPVWTYRAPAVVLGALSIALAARIGWRQSRASGVAAACLASSALPLVIYGSEARGYAGLIACSLLAIDAFETALQRPDPRPGWQRAAAWRLGAAIGIGTLFHFTMLAMLAVLGVAALMRFGRDRPPRDALDATLSLFGPSLLMLLPAMLAVSAGIAHCGGFMFGSVSPSAAGTFFRGYGDQLRFMLGLPDRLSQIGCFLVAGVIVLLRLCLGDVVPSRRLLALAAILILPGAMLLVGLPNLKYARYFLVPGLFMLLTEADLIGALYNRGARSAKIAATLVLGSSLVGQGLADWSALKLGRGLYGNALATLADRDGRVTYGSHDRFWVEAVAQAAAVRRGLAAHFVDDVDFCRQTPDWFVDVPDTAGPPAPEIVAGPKACRLRFALYGQVITGPLSGMSWTIYKRAG